jgi:hypothetical protein
MDRPKPGKPVTKNKKPTNKVNHFGELSYVLVVAGDKGRGKK